MTEICKHCNRLVRSDEKPDPPLATHFGLHEATVNHRGYGCDTGCCGYEVEVYDKYGMSLHSMFEFTHPYWTTDDQITEEEYNKNWAEDFVQVHFGSVPINWDRSEIRSDID